MRPAALLAALLVLMIAPAGAAHAAATVSATARSIPDYNGGVSTALSVLATGDAAADDIRAAGIYGDFHLALGILISDAAGAVASNGCEQVDATSVRCMVPTQQIGNSTVGATLDGGRGDDRLFAGDVALELFGGRGADRLRAGSGHNLLDGGRGTDVFTNVGRGDTVHARDRRRDVVRCSRRPLRVVADRGDSLRGCGHRIRPA